VSVSGFVAHELREARIRVGFAIETFDGHRATLAHVDFRGPPRVGKYGVDVAAFERIALPALGFPPRDNVVVLDELGKMELASPRFRDAVSRLFEAPVSIVATVHVFRHAFTDALKRRPDVELVRVTKASRDELPRQLADRLTS
jgi:nucleoside-triphosphatase